ncbi:MAG: Endo-1,4-beta-xylanase A precursor [Firmicutes bacterium ADurb.Bin146]|nr:MAG: Endo-1,4-beta-xylanase A precursor [Firmicutes bacterium ADurb.Bin146]
MKSGIKKMLSLLIILCVFLAYLQPAALHVSAENVPICEISSVGYNSLADALAVIRTNETIKLLTNIDYNSGISFSDKNITFNLNGFTLNVTNPNNDGAFSTQCGLYVSGTSTISIIGAGEFNVQGNRYGVYATCLNPGDANVTVTNASSPAGTAVYSDKAIVTVKTNINAGYEGAFANLDANITIEGNVIVNSATGNSSGLNMISSSTFTVHGDIIVNGDFMVGVRGNDSCNITVNGNIFCTGINTVAVEGNGSTVIVNGSIRAFQTGIKARSYSNITVNGDITSYSILNAPDLMGANASAIYAYNGSTVIVNGNLYSENYGVYITDEGGLRVPSTVTINGFVQSAPRSENKYVYFETDNDGIIFENGTLNDPLMPEYRKYNNLSGTVYVSKFGGGTGVIADPYIINHSHQLYNVRANLANNFKLGQDIDMTYFVPDSGWLPIGTSVNKFTGIFDGNNKTINNLKIQRTTLSSTPNFLGLFAYTDTTSVLKDMTLSGVNINGWNYIGSVAGENNGYILNVNASIDFKGDEGLGGIAGNNKGTIENSHVTGLINDNFAYYVGGLAGYNNGTIKNSYFIGTITADEYIGGLVGKNIGAIYDSYAEITINGGWRTAGLIGLNVGLVKNSYSKGSIISWGDFVGGLVGVNSNQIDSCYSTCSVQADYTVGGLVGFNTGSIKLSYAIGNVTGDGTVGGLVGEHDSSVSAILENCYSRGNVTSGSGAGGLTAINENNIQNCYSTGTVTKIGSYGGLIGDDGSSDEGVATFSYWDTQTSGISASYGGEGKTTVLMKTASTYNSWDFSTIWGINGIDNDGYPYLRWQGFSLVKPVLSAISISSITRNTAILTFNSDSAGTYYYLVYSPEDSAPDALTIKAQGVAVANGTDDAVVGANTASVAGLVSDTSYKIYVVVENLVGTLSNVHEVLFTTLPPNRIPNRVALLGATYSETVTVNTAFTLNLNNVFEDADADVLTYTVSVNGGAAVSASAAYSYTPTVAGDTMLVFKANDGQDQSADTFTVTVTAAVPVYALNIAAGAGGSITPGANGNYAQGTVITISASPNALYVFSGWSSTAGGVFGDASSASTTFTMPGNEVSIHASFTPVPPVLSLVSVSNISATSAVLNYTSDIAGTAYYMVLASDAAAPDAANLKLSGIAIGAVGAGNTITLTSLSSSASYKAYILVKGSNGADSAVSAVAFATLAPPNNIPNRISSVPAIFTETVTVNTAFTLNLNNVFEDADADVLTYTVYINGGAAVSASAAYSYTPTVAGDTMLVFRANDGQDQSADTFTVTVTAADIPPAPPVVLYQFDISANTGGSIESGFSDSFSSGTCVGISAIADTGYEFVKWVSSGSGEFIDAYRNTTTFIMPDEDVSITAEFIYIGIVEESSDSGYIAKINGRTEVTCPVTVNSSGKLAYVKPSDDMFSDSDNTFIDVPEIPNALSYSLSLSVARLSNQKRGSNIIFKSPLATIALPDNMLSSMISDNDKKAVITIRQADKEDLSEEFKSFAGDRPIIQLSLMLDDQELEWENPEVPVQITIPYTPTKEELLNPEFITIWTQDDAGELICITNGKYDIETGTVTFRTRYFKYFAIGYNKKDVLDIKENFWYTDAIKYSIARNILLQSNNHYGPNDELSREELVVMIFKAYNIAIDDEYNENFNDADNPETLKYLAKAKSLGISNGIGDNLFNPNSKLTRQEMFTMTYRLLNVLNEVPEDKFTISLNDFHDSEKVALWARKAIDTLMKAGIIKGNENYIYPTDIATKAEFAQLLYNLLNK